ncbi:MAG: hypothetical protein WC740_17260 [Verrucomicrobiia bacterium]
MKEMDIMRCSRNLMLGIVFVVFLTMGPCSGGMDLKYYAYLPAGIHRDVCRDAVLANPQIVKQVQAIAEHYVKQIQSELATLGKRYPALAGVGQTQIELSSPREAEKVLCGLSFQKNTRPVAVPSGVYAEPDKDGCVLIVWVHNILASSSPRRHSDMSDWFLVHEIELHASYLLRLSENDKHIEKDLRALIERHIKEMCAEMKKLQTAEDKAAAIYQ